MSHSACNPSIRIIVNADDLGQSPNINAIISRLIQMGRITSATLLAVGPAFEEAVQVTTAFPGCSFGAHLCLSEFSPLTQVDVFRRLGLLDERGFFNNRLRTISPSYAVLRAVIVEWCAQLARMRDAGIPISHLDSHHHVHTIPWLFPAVKFVQRRFNIRSVRRSMDLYGAGYDPPLSRRLEKALWNGSLRRIYATQTTDRFGELVVFDQLYREGHLPAGVQTYELMAHPGNRFYKDGTEMLQASTPPIWMNGEILCSYRTLGDVPNRR